MVSGGFKGCRILCLPRVLGVSSEAVEVQGLGSSAIHKVPRTHLLTSTRTFRHRQTLIPKPEL